MKKKIFVAFIIACQVMCLSSCGANKDDKNVTSQVAEIDTGVEKGAEESTEENSTVTENNTDNLLENGDFSKELQGWNVYLEGGGNSSLAVVEGIGKLTIMNIGELNYSNQLYYDGFSLKEGGVYELSFDMASTIPRSLEARIQLNGGDYRAYVAEFPDINEDMQSFSYKFTMTEPTDLAPRLCFNLGIADGLSNDMHIVKLDNVNLKLLDDSNIADEGENGGINNISINQIGYASNDDKTAAIRNHAKGDIFTIVDKESKEVYSGVLSEEKHSEAADETVTIADFSEFTTNGEYTLKVGEDESYSFSISENPYTLLTTDVVRMMYLQRCTMDLTDDLAGNFAHKVCHDREALIYGSQETKEVNGGWHDAGDFGKYVVTGAQTAIDMLLCYENNPDTWKADDLKIPESGNGIPDVLDEVKYELDWMLKMQDEKNGGVWHKVSTYNFPAFIMPDEDDAELVISPISTTATGDFAAIMAKASIVYADIDKKFSENCLNAAKKAWGYLEVTECNGGFKNPGTISTGEYPDESDVDERYWAAVELFKATGDKKYQDYFEKQLEEEVLTGYGWIEMGSYGNIAYLSMDSKNQKQEFVEKIKNTIIDQANLFLDTASKDGYGCCLTLEGYNWGSNLGVCNNARTMLLAGEFTGDDKYYKCAKEQLDYLLGKNALSISFVTGYGQNCSKDVHHRPSVVKGEAMKGMLVGGPNSGIEDPYAANVLNGMPPAKCYADNQQSYATNEVTIYWNSPFMCLLTELQK